MSYARTLFTDQEVTKREDFPKLWIDWIRSEKGSPPLSQHPSARLTPMGRRTLCGRVEAGELVSTVARQMGVSRQTAHKWLRRWRAGMPMADASPRPRSSPTRTPPDVRDLVVGTRLALRCNALALAAVTGVPARTCSRIVAAAGCPALSEYDPVRGGLRPHGPATRTRYERDGPGDLVHVDVKKVARIPDGGGWRANGRAADGHHRGTGVRCLHVAVDDRSRVCYAELHDDERRATCVGFLRRAAAFYTSVGAPVREVMTDNGPAYRSRAFAEELGLLGAGHVFTRPYSPWQNGKVERMNQTLAREWAYARPYTSEEERAEALSSFVDYYNWDRPHSACGGLPPMSRVNNVLAINN